MNQPETKYFLCRLLPPRPSFALDMSESEQKLMAEHAAYWTSHLERGQVVVFGPVMDPQGPWGLGIVRMPDEAAVQAFQAGDPVTKSGLGFAYQVMWMPSPVLPTGA